MWGMKAWQIRQQREWIETLCMQRDDANREAESRRNVVKRLAAQVEEQRQQNLRLVRDNRTLREELSRCRAALAQPVSESEFLAKVHEEFERQAVKEQADCPHDVWKNVPDRGTASGDMVPVCMGCGLVWKGPQDDSRYDCPHTARLDTSENGGSVVVCTACLETLDQTDDSGDEAAADEEDGA